VHHHKMPWLLAIAALLSYSLSLCNVYTASG